MVNPHLEQSSHAAGPAPGEKGCATILIHGRNQTADYMLDIAARIDLPDMPYIALQAHENSWYPEGFMAPLEDNQPFLDDAIEVIDRTVRGLNGEGVADERIMFIGFSQGACLAAEFVYCHPRHWGGLVVFTGGLIGPQGKSWSTGESLDAMPVLIASSDDDEWVPLSRTVETAGVFAAMGAEVTMKIYPGLDHSVNEDEVDLARKLLDGKLTG